MSADQGPRNGPVVHIFFFLQDVLRWTVRLPLDSRLLRPSEEGLSGSFGGCSHSWELVLLFTSPNLPRNDRGICLA